ncbi:MAG: 3-oxoacyl-ACP reductase FabG [Acidobacteriia bacterium]|nr:3-oxoacyl-ACP reductase FabG [Terriglobia bacterium]
MIEGNGNGSRWANLKGKVALVTGAARGIGRAIALELAERGADVAINYRNSKEHAESLAKQIRGMGSDCLLIPGDVSNKEDAHHVVETVLDSWKRLDILVNNAGITRDKSLRKMADDEWADVINVNLNGTFYCTSAALPAMMEQQFGRIINIASYVGQGGNLGQANYAASTGGIIAFTKSLALEMAKYNITANAIAPGFTSTEMLSKVPTKILEQIRVKIPLQRFARPDEVAKAAGFLAADGDYITGQQLNVSGGLYM